MIAKAHWCHAEQSEASRIFKVPLGRDSSPEFILSAAEGAQNDIATQSLRGEKMRGRPK